jgi:hypothetical protein
LQENQQTVHWTYRSGITDPYDDFAIDGSTEQHVRVMDVIEFGWEDDPALDVTIDEAKEDEDYQVNMVRQPGPHYLDGHGVPGVRARLQAGRQAVPVTGRVNPVQVPLGPVLTHARLLGPAPFGAQGIENGALAFASNQIDGVRFQGIAAPTSDAGSMASSGQPLSPNVPTVTTTVALKWIPIEVFIQLVLALCCIICQAGLILQQQQVVGWHLKHVLALVCIIGLTGLISQQVLLRIWEIERNAHQGKKGSHRRSQGGPVTPTPQQEGARLGGNQSHRRKRLRSGSSQRERSHRDVGGLDRSEGRGSVSARKSLWDAPLQEKEERWESEAQGPEGPPPLVLTVASRGA